MTIICREGLRGRVAGCRMQGAGCRVQDAGCRVQGESGSPVIIDVIYVTIDFSSQNSIFLRK
jgi:hypothetical protein